MRCAILAIVLASSVLGGCRYDPDKSPPVTKLKEPAETFVVPGSAGKEGGTVKVEEVDGVPRLTVDVYGE